MEAELTKKLYSSAKKVTPEPEIDYVLNDNNYYYHNDFDQIISEREATGESYDDFISTVSDTNRKESERMSLK